MTGAKQNRFLYLMITSPYLENKNHLDNLPDPDVLAGENIENLEAGLESFREIMVAINGKG